MRTTHAVNVRFLVAACCVIMGCTSEDAPLAPYGGGGRDVSLLKVEENVFSPRVTWVGGNVTALGVNRGKIAALDSTLVTLLVAPNDGLPIQTRVGTVPAGAQDLSSQFGGIAASRLIEDATYTYWVMKGDVWAQISSRRGARIIRDSTTSTPVRFSGDSVFVSAKSHSQLTRLLDVYINIKDVAPFGRLGVISVTASDTSNRPLVTFRITQVGVTDTMVAALGVVRGGIYNVTAVAWEMISKEVLPDTTIYWKKNVIPPRVLMGEIIPGTETFVSYPPDGLVRGYQYYVWIAHKDWDAQNRTRSTPYYAFSTFTVW